MPSVSTFQKMALKYSHVQPHQVFLLMLLFLKLTAPVIPVKAVGHELSR